MECISIVTVEVAYISAEAVLFASLELSAESVCSAVPCSLTVGNKESLLAHESGASACLDLVSSASLEAVSASLEAALEVPAILIRLLLSDSGAAALISAAVAPLAVGDHACKSSISCLRLVISVVKQSIAALAEP